MPFYSAGQQPANAMIIPCKYHVNKYSPVSFNIRPREPRSVRAPMSAPSGSLDTVSGGGAHWRSVRAARARVSSTRRWDVEARVGGPLTGASWEGRARVRAQGACDILLRNVYGELDVF